HVRALVHGHAPEPGTASPRTPAAPVGTWGAFHLRLLERLAPPSVVVDADHDIVHLSDNAGQFLQFVGGEPTNNLLRLVDPALRLELRAALYQAAQGESRIDVPAVLVDVGGE